MRAEFFQNQIERLRKVYSPASLNEERVKIMWDRFKNEREETFERALNHVIGEATTQALPAISKISEAISFSRQSDRTQGHVVIELPAPWRCSECRDDGWVADGYSVTTRAGVVRACVCAAGRARNPAELAKIQSDFDKGGELMRGKRLGGISIGQPLPYNPNERIDQEAW